MPTLVANAQGSVGPGTPLTVSITVPSGSNQVLVVFVSCVDNTDKMASGATVTYNGTSMGSAVASEPAGDRNFAYAYVLAAPTTGTHNVVVTPSSSSYLSAFAEVWNDVHQTTPVLSSDHYAAAFPPLSPTALTRTITIASGNVAADMMTVRNSSATVTPAGTAIGTNAGVSTISTCKASYTTGSASQTSWTINQNNATSLTIVLQPPASADTTPPTLTSPVGSGATLTGSGTVSTDEANGTLWWKADATSTASDPGAGSESGAGWASQTVSATGTQTVSSFGALSAGTYYVHFLHVDAAGNRSTVANSSSFTVTAAGTSAAPARAFKLAILNH